MTNISLKVLDEHVLIEDPKTFVATLKGHLDMNLVKSYITDLKTQPDYQSAMNVYDELVLRAAKQYLGGHQLACSLRHAVMDVARLSPDPKPLLEIASYGLGRCATCPYITQAEKNLLGENPKA